MVACMRIGKIKPPALHASRQVRFCYVINNCTFITRQHGFTYLAVLIALAIIGATLASTGMVWHTAVQREKERELLFVGNQIRQAIGRYYLAEPVKQYPQTLDDLLRDPRQPGVVRHLRKLYPDPITGTTEWGLLKGRDGRITGVYSLSLAQPIKQANFRGADQMFAEKEKYSDWQFVYRPTPPAKANAKK